jgi:hypothetical protein
VFGGGDKMEERREVGVLANSAVEGWGGLFTRKVK